MKEIREEYKKFYNVTNFSEMSFYEIEQNLEKKIIINKMFIYYVIIKNCEKNVAKMQDILEECK